MFSAKLPHWCARRAERPAAGERPRDAAAASHAPRVPRPDSAIHAVEVAVSHTPDDLTVRIKGEATFQTAETLLYSLLAASALRPAIVTLDLSELHCISSLAMGVLVSFGRGVVRSGGRVRLAEQLQPGVKEALARAELPDLFDTTADAEAAVSR